MTSVRVWRRDTIHPSGRWGPEVEPYHPSGTLVSRGMWSSPVALLLSFQNAVLARKVSTSTSDSQQVPGSLLQLCLLNV